MRRLFYKGLLQDTIEITGADAHHLMHVMRARPGQEIIVTRCLHRSLLLGLVLAGLRPVWVLPERDPATGLPAAVAVETVRAALVTAFDEADILVRGYPVDGVRITIADAASNDRVLAVLAAHPELRQ